MQDTPLLGPVALCTLITEDGKALAEAYTSWLHQQLADSGELDVQTAAAIGYPQLAGNRYWLLANAQGRRWLQIVECKGAGARDSLKTFGWLAMEVLVADVDTLAASLENSPFELLRPPADLDVSDKIRACQVRGPAGEVLYLTHVHGDVPPFDLPTCEAPVDHLFIAVLSTPSRDRSLKEYTSISANEGISFDTRVTVVNQDRGFDLDRRHPVATLQLAGQALIEFDQIADTVPPTPGVCSGIASIAFYCQRPAPELAANASTGPFKGHRTCARVGCADEIFTLVYR